MGPTRLLDRELRAAGWVKTGRGLGWEKNGAYYFRLGGVQCVGQFEKDNLPYKFSIDLPLDLPSAVLLHIINSTAEARTVLEATQ